MSELERHGEPSAATELAFDPGGETVGLVERTHLVAGGAIVGATVGAERQMAISESRVGGFALAAVNGWSGDKLEQGSHPLRIPMTLRKRRRVVNADRGGLSAAYPDASGKLVVFIHGLMETEDIWWLGTGPAGDGGERRPNYGERMQAELGYTPLYLRYNSGLHVSENGHWLATLLDRVVACWPVEVTEIVLFGHSMGGLVARSANHYAIEEGSGYVNLVRHVIYSGTPHHRSPLEQFANGGAKLLSVLPETRAFGDLVNSRAAGVKDMRYGNILDSDWQDHERPTAPTAASRSSAVATTAASHTSISHHTPRSTSRSTPGSSQRRCPPRPDHR